MYRPRADIAIGHLFSLRGSQNGEIQYQTSVSQEIVVCQGKGSFVVDFDPCLMKLLFMSLFGKSTMDHNGS